MSYGSMNTKELARFLGFDARQLERDAQRGTIPCRKVRGQLLFNRSEIHDWLQQSMITMNSDTLEQVDGGITTHRQTEQDQAIIVPLLRQSAITTHLDARTKGSVLRKLLALAQTTDLIYDNDALLESVQEREELQSTAIDLGIAIVHPLQPQPYTIADTVFVVAKSPQKIIFGAPDGSLTDLFFFIAAQDSHQHLHLLARLCRMLQDPYFVEELKEAQTQQRMRELLIEREAIVIAC